MKNISESVTCVFQVPNSNRKILISLKPGETKLIGKDTQNTQKSQIPIDISSLIHNFNKTTGTKKHEQAQDQTHNNPHASGSDTCTPCRYYQPEHLMLYCNHNRQIELLAIGEFWLNGQRYFSKRRSRKILKNYYKRYDKLTSNFVVAYEDNYRKNIEKAAQTVNEFNKLKSVRNGVAEAEFQQFCRCDELESASQFDGNNYLLEVYHELKQIAMQHDLLDNWSTIDKHGRFEKLKTVLEKQEKMKQESDKNKNNQSTCVELQTDGSENLGKTTRENFYDGNLYSNFKKTESQEEDNTPFDIDASLIPALVEPSNEPAFLPQHSVFRVGCYTFIIDLL